VGIHKTQTSGNGSGKGAKRIVFVSLNGNGPICQFIWDERALGWRRRAQPGAETAARGDRRGSLRPDISEINGNVALSVRK